MLWFAGPQKRRRHDLLSSSWPQILTGSLLPRPLRANAARIRRDVLVSFALPIVLIWMAVAFLGILYWYLPGLWLALRPPKTTLPPLNVGPVGMAILGASFGVVFGPLFGQMMYRRKADRAANLVSAVLLILVAVFALLRYGFTPSIIFVDETFSDYFIAVLIVTVLLTSAFPVLHYIAKPDSRAIRPPLTSRRRRRRRARSTR